MNPIVNLIQAALGNLPFKSEAAAAAFLSQFSVDDQARLINVSYIGRDHLHDNTIKPNYTGTLPFDRTYIVGVAPNWEIQPADFARTLAQHSGNLKMYLDAFLRCMSGSKLSLQPF